MYVTHPVPPGLRITDDAAQPAPSAETLALVEQVWREETASRPGLFNGRLFSMTGLEGGLVRGFMAEYRWYLAQYRRPELFPELAVRSLAVSGLIEARGHLLFGLRKGHLAIEGGLWELVPSGTINPDRREPDGSLSWRGVFFEELREELGLDVQAQPEPFALVEDTKTNIWELGAGLRLDMDHRDILAAWAALETTEHSELAAVPVADASRFLAERGPAMTGVTGPLLAAWGSV